MTQTVPRSFAERGIPASGKEGKKGFNPGIYIKYTTLEKYSKNERGWIGFPSIPSLIGNYLP